MKSIKVIMGDAGKKSSVLHQISNDEKEKLQSVLFSILVDFNDLCKKVGVTYCLVGGSALGSVRHKDFIPWDDDIDLGMSRDEWEIFKKACPPGFSNKYEIESTNYYKRDTKFLQQRIYLKDSEYILPEEINFPYSKGIFIDILVIDKVSDNIIVRKMDGIIADCMRIIATSILDYKYPNALMNELMAATIFSRTYFFARRTLGFFFCWCSHRKWCDMYDKFVSRHENSHTRLRTVGTGQKRYFGEILDSEIWFPYSEGVFRGMRVNLPHDVHRYLTEIYGSDYMQLPPVEKRVLHPIVSLRFPDQKK